MTKRITSEDCEGNIEDIEDGRYNSHVVPVASEDDPGYEEIDYGDCTEFTVPLGRYGSHVVPVGGGGGGGGGAACPDGGLKAGTTIDGKDCLSLSLMPGGAIVLQNGQLAIDTSKLKITTDQVLPSGTNTGIVIDGPDGEVWNTQADYNQWLYDEITNVDHSDYVTQDEFKQDQDRQDQELEDYKQEVSVDQDRQDKALEDYKKEVSADQDRQDAEINEIKVDINKSEDPVDGSVSYRFVTHPEFQADQNRQEQELEDYKKEVQADQDRQDTALQDEIDARVERDALHDAEIDTLEYKLDALLGLTFRGTYEFKHEADCDAAYEQCMGDCIAMDPQDVACRNLCTENLINCEKDKVRPGFFEAVDPDDQFDHLEQIVISKNDASGVEVDWAGVLSAGDYLEVDHVFAGALDKTNYGLYRITEDPEANTNAYGEAVYTMKLQFLQGDGVMNEGEKYEIRGITAAEGVNPEELGDFLTKDQAAATYLPLAGGTLTGTLNMDGDAAVKTRHLDSGQNSNLKLKHNGVVKIYVGADQTAFNHNVDLKSNGLNNAARVQLNPGGHIASGSNERIIIRDGDGNNAGTEIGRIGDDVRTFSIKGKAEGSSTVTDFFWAYANVGSGGDAINYTGKIEKDNNIVNKKWVDDNKAPKTHSHSNYASSSHSHGSTYIKSRDKQDIKIYKSGNLFYIE